MSVALQWSIEDYRNTYHWIVDKTSGLSEEQLRRKPAPDKWSVKEIVAHLVDSSLVHSVRIRKIAAEPDAPLLLYSQDAWVADSRSNEAAIQDVLEAYQAVLSYNVLFYSRLSGQDWQKTGLNGDTRVTLADLFQGFIRHVNTHLAQIDRTLAGLAAASANTN